MNYNDFNEEKDFTYNIEEEDILKLELDLLVKTLLIFQMKIQERIKDYAQCNIEKSDKDRLLSFYEFQKQNTLNNYNEMLRLIKINLATLKQTDTPQKIKIASFLKEEYVLYIKDKIKTQKDAQILRREERKWEEKAFFDKIREEEEIFNIQNERSQKLLSAFLQGKDFVNNIDENTIDFLTYDEDIFKTKLGKDYVQYSNHSKSLNIDRNSDHFREYQSILGKEKETRSERNKKDFTKYTIIGINPPYEKNKISKRQLPTEIIKYLIYYNILKEENLKDFSTNQFGRTFEAKMGDIITEEELPTDPNRAKRYNLLDFTQIIEMNNNSKAIIGLDELLAVNPCKLRKKLYVSTEWDKNSLEKFIEYIRKNYKDYISIGHSTKEE